MGEVPVEVRPSLAGIWYPADPIELRTFLEDGFERARGSPASDDVCALLVPHAGLQYSGHVSASGYAALSARVPEALVILSPLHSYHRSTLLTSAYGAYQTPLGRMPVDDRLRDSISASLQDRLGVSLMPLRDDSEHSIEVQLPFLQWRLGEAPFVPIMMAAQTMPIARGLAEALVETLPAGESLVIASSDLSHYRPLGEAELLDREFLSRVLRLDAPGVMGAQEQGVGYACGRAAISSALWWAVSIGARGARLLHYSTSAETTGNAEAVVGYAAVCIERGDGYGSREEGG